MEIVLATYNEGKAREIVAIMDPVRVICLKELGVDIDFDTVENGNTYAENAFKKVHAAAAEVDGIIVADDSGIEVEALGGGPGIHSARYAGENAPAEALYGKLIEELKDVPETERGARFVCVVAIRLPDGTEKKVEGECKGSITFEPRGSGGFGYDPVFLLPDRNLTMAQISAEEKNRISHRARAFRALRAVLLGQ